MVHDTSPSPAYFDDEMDFPPASSSPEPSPIPAASPSPEPTQNTGPIAVANSVNPNNGLFVAASAADMEPLHFDYQQLARNIKQLQKKYQKNELKIPAKAVTKALMDLAALEQYTAHAQGLQAKHDQLRERLKTTAPSLRSKLRGKMSKIHPMTTASNTVADRFGKGPWFARRLRRMASYVLRTQELPPSTQGKGAQRLSFFNCSEVRSALEKWVKGLIPTDQGGFEGQVRMDV